MSSLSSGSVQARVDDLPVASSWRGVPAASSKKPASAPRIGLSDVAVEGRSRVSLEETRIGLRDRLQVPRIGLSDVAVEGRSRVSPDCNTGSNRAAAMGSALSAAYTALCSFVDAFLDKADMWWLIATDPYIRSATAEERENTRRWYRELDRPEPEEHSRSTGTDFTEVNIGRCNYRHPSCRDKDDNPKYKKLSRDKDDNHKYNL